MIYLDNITEAQDVFLPRTGISAEGDLALTVRSTVNLTDYTATVSVQEDGTSSLYWHAEVTLPEGLQDGSYEYTLTQGGVTVSQGCLIVGEYIDPYTEYYSNDEYEQYDGQ